MSTDTPAARSIDRHPAVAVDAEALARVGTALADPTRRRLLLALIDGPAYPSDLADRLALSRTNVSNHLSCLRGCGLITPEPIGRRVRYALSDPRMATALAQLASLVLITTTVTTTATTTARTSVTRQAGDACDPADYADYSPIDSTDGDESSDCTSPDCIGSSDCDDHKAAVHG